MSPIEGSYPILWIILRIPHSMYVPGSFLPKSYVHLWWTCSWVACATNIVTEDWQQRTGKIQWSGIPSSNTVDVARGAGKMSSHVNSRMILENKIRIRRLD